MVMDSVVHEWVQSASSLTAAFDALVVQWASDWVMKVAGSNPSLANTAGVFLL